MILVTGGTGFLGAELIRQLLVRPDCPPIRSLYRASSSFSYFTAAERERIEWVEADLLDFPNLRDAFKGVTHVYHCAALISFSPKHEEQMMAVNVEGTRFVVDLCLAYGVEKLIHVSSVAAIGRRAKSPEVDETVEWDSESKLNTAYAKSKYAAELEVWRGTAEGLNATMVNPSIILGPMRWDEGSGKLFAQADAEFPFYTDGATGVVDVTDVARAMIELMASDISAERFIVNGHNVSFRNLMTHIAKALDRRPPSRRAGNILSNLAWRWAAVKQFFTGKEPLLTQATAMVAQRSFRYDSSKLERTLGFQFTPLDETIERTAAAYRRDVPQHTDD